MNNIARASSLLPKSRSISEHFTLQQDNVPAHRANETVEFCLTILPITSHRGCGHRTHRTWIRLTTKCGVCSKNACTVGLPGFETLTIWSSEFSKSGITLTRESLTEQCISGVFDYVSVFEQKEATLSTNCNQHCAAWLSHVGVFWRQYIICCISETK